MKYNVVLLLCILSWSSLVCCQIKCTSSGEYGVISDKSTKIVIPDKSIAQPYEPDIQIPSVCNVDRTCSSLLFEVKNEQSRLLEKHFWVPNNGPTRYYKLNVSGSDRPPVNYGPTLHGNDCFKFFQIDNHRLGALCIGRIYDENLIIPYKIQYNEEGELQDNQLGIQIHLNIEYHSPFIVLNNTEGLQVVGISYFEHLSEYKLFIIHYRSESYDVIDVPPQCTGPHDLQPIKQSDVVIRCANGEVLYFNGWYSTFTTLSHNNIEIMSVCTNTMSYVLVQDTGSIFFNKSGVIYQLSVNASGQPLRITSAVCHATDDDEITYYFFDAASNAVYKLYLRDILTASSRQALVPQLVRNGFSRDDAVISLYIDGPILWGKQALLNSSDVTVYIIDLLTQKQSLPVSVNGPNVFVQLYTPEKCEHSTVTPANPTNGKQENSNGQTIGDMPQYVVIPVAVVTFLILLIILIGFGFVVYHRRIRRPRRPHMQDNMENDSLEMEPIGEARSNNRSQTPGSTDNSAAPLIQERYDAGTLDNQQPPMIIPDNSTDDTKPVQITNQQPGQLVYPTNKVPVEGSDKNKIFATNTCKIVAIRNPGPSLSDEVD